VEKWTWWHLAPRDAYQQPSSSEHQLTHTESSHVNKKEGSGRRGWARKGEKVGGGRVGLKRMYTLYKWVEILQQNKEGLCTRQVLLLGD
jgi:hypothetical protein